MTAPLTPERVAHLLRSSLGQTYRYLPRTTSTQDELRHDDPEGTIVAADEQTAGRGRRGQAWHAPSGHALLMSVLLRPGSSRPIAQISLVTGVVVAAVVGNELGVAAGIKWPNDVLVGRAKVAGILAEQRGEVVAVGIGVNVNQTAAELPATTPIPATSMRIVDGQVRDRAALLARVASGLETSYRAWQAEGLATMAAELESRDVLRGQRIRVDAVEGIAAGIGPDGALLVEQHDGARVPVVAGSVEVSW